MSICYISHFIKGSLSGYLHVEASLFKLMFVSYIKESTDHPCLFRAFHTLLQLSRDGFENL